MEDQEHRLDGGDDRQGGEAGVFGIDEGGVSLDVAEQIVEELGCQVLCGVHARTVFTVRCRCAWFFGGTR